MSHILITQGINLTSFHVGGIVKIITIKRIGVFLTCIRVGLILSNIYFITPYDYKFTFTNDGRKSTWTLQGTNQSFYTSFPFLRVREGVFQGECKFYKSYLASKSCNGSYPRFIYDVANLDPYPRISVLFWRRADHGMYQTWNLYWNPYNGVYNNEN